MTEDNIIPYRPPGKLNGAATLDDASPLERDAAMDWDRLGELTPPERTWHINHWLTTGPTLFAGMGGIGKTLIAQTLATALALGKRFLEDVSKPMVVLMWACEDEHDELWRRQVAINRFFGVSMSELTDLLIIKPRLGLDNTLLGKAFGNPSWTRLRDELKQQIHDYGADVLFLDNVGQTFVCDESDRGHVTMFLNGLAGLGRPGAFSPVVMAHPARAAGSEYAGSAAWENAVRMRWMLSMTQPDAKAEDAVIDESVRYLSKRKANYTARDCIKLVRRDGVLAPEDSQPKLFQQLYGGGLGDRKGEAEACVLAALRKLQEREIRSTDSQNTGDYLPKKMQEMGLTSDFTRKELGDALARMRLDGRVVVGVVGRYQNRSPKEGLRLP
jgi:RecA-family ATPase